jgi:hypothetical protein
MPTRSQLPAAKPAVQPRNAAMAILVLGMHRSGTSAIARVLNLRGADLGRDLLPPKQDNERGFWENAAILALHERFLAAQQWHWHDLLTPADHWQQDVPAREFVAGLPAVLTQQYGDSKLLLVKDPRLSLLAPLWIEVLSAKRVRPVFVITIRHPDEVAASLAERDGFSFARSRWLWLQHLAEAERATRGHPRVFVHYERLLADWRSELARIGKQLSVLWPTEPAGFDGAVAQFIAPALRHHQGESDAGNVLPAVLRRVYERACAAASDTVPAAATFDDVLTDFDEWMQLTAPLYHDLTLRQEQSDEQHALEIGRARETFAAKENEIAKARSNIDTLAAQLEQARAAHDARDQLETDLRAALAAREVEVDAARRNIDALSADLDQARATIAAKDGEIETARRNVDALTGEIAHARDAFALKEEEIAAARRSLAELQDTLASKERDIAAARVNIDARIAEIDAARRNIDNLVAEIERARQAHELRDATEATLRGDLQALRQSRWFRLGRSLHVIDGEKS